MSADDDDACELVTLALVAALIVVAGFTGGVALLTRWLL